MNNKQETEQQNQKYPAIYVKPDIIIITTTTEEYEALTENLTEAKETIWLGFLNGYINDEVYLTQGKIIHNMHRQKKEDNGEEQQ